MTLESRPERPSTIEQRLGEPDYTGSWNAEYPVIEGRFRMWVLQRLPTVPQDNIYGERIEGIISDQLGFSIFSGKMGSDLVSHRKVIEFVKVYSQPARSRGAFDRIDYRGQLDEEVGIFRGTWSISGTQLSDEFFLVVPQSRTAQVRT